MTGATATTGMPVGGTALRETATSHTFRPASTGVQLCRFPADCDLSMAVAGMQADIAELKAQMQTLLGLLGAPVRAVAEMKRAKAGLWVA